ncbi:hypothetical protein JCM1841_004580 [Sporobolomyces salmonicolor]
MAPKPKGLKASKRAAPFDPSTTVDESAASTSTPAASNPERTYPLDEDALTLADLFELRSSVVDILYPFPNSLSLAHADPDRFDEARSLLRGILHGCAVLEQFVEPRSYHLLREVDETGPKSLEAVRKRMQEAGQEKLKALGLNDEFTEGMILYLQGWALQHLGEIFEKPEEALRAGAIKSATGSKKRKIDVNEPHSKEGWLEAAFERFDLLFELALASYSQDLRDECCFVALINAGHVDCKVSLAEAYYEAGKDDEATKVAPKSRCRDLSNFIEVAWGIDHHDAYIDEHLNSGDAVLAQLRAWSKYIAFVEAHPSAEPAKAVAELKDGIALLKLMDRHFSTASERSNDDEKKALPLWTFLRDVVATDARLARFILLEDVVESTYRPDAGEEDDEEDEEAEVKPLPLDAKEVVEAKQAGEEALSALRATITAFSSLPASFAHPSAKDGQYRKLEEALLVYSALINPDEKAATEKIEKEIAQVRKDGGFEEDEEGAADRAEK